MTTRSGSRLVLSRTGTELPPESEKEIRPADELEKDAKSRSFESWVFMGLVLTFQTFMLVIYSLWITYEEEEIELEIYPYFRDVNIMIFFGFGFLMSFLRRYGYSAIGYTLLFSAIVVEWSVLLELFFIEVELDEEDKFSPRRGISIVNLLHGLFAAGAVMISFGAVLGKVTPTQLVLLAIIEPAFFWLNVYIGSVQLQAFDIGGGMYIHTFGAYFGLTVTWFLTSKDSHSHPDNCSCYSSDIFSLAGTLLLWLLWPSFNAAEAVGIEQSHVLVNTFLSLVGSTVSTFVVSRLVNSKRFDPVHIQNSTLAGGVIMGTAGHLKLFPATAIGCGILIGAISVLGYKWLTPAMSKYLKIQDVCGVHNLHGIPGFLSGLVAVFAAIDLDSPTFARGGDQPWYNLAELFVTIGFAVVGGAICGAVMLGARYLHRMLPEDNFNDRSFWENPSDYNNVVNGPRAD